MTEDKFDQKIKSSLAGEMIPSEELINNTKQGVRKAQKLEKRWMICIHAIWIVLLSVVLVDVRGRNSLDASPCL